MGEIGAVLPEAQQSSELNQATSGHWLPYAVAAIVSLALLAYALTLAFVWDEGFHLLAAQSILNGKRPYIDFCFPQTPLNAYWNAGWMALFGQSWRVTHLAASVLLSGTLFLLAWSIPKLIPEPKWRTASATSAIVMLGLNYTVVQFAPIAQAYAICMCAGTLAYVFAVRAAKGGIAWAALSGLFAGIAAGSSLLSAPVALAIWLWLLLQRDATNRWKQPIAFLCGAAVAFIPVLKLLVQAPYQTLFNVVRYQALFRTNGWPGATAHDVEILSGWTDSGQALLLGGLALVAVVYLRRSHWNRVAKQPFHLAGWIALACVVYLSTAHPTFSRYYLVATPFMAILSAPALPFLFERLARRPSPAAVAAGITIFSLVAVGHDLFVHRESVTWSRYEEVSRKVADVTPRTAHLFADEQVYFLLRRTPPFGMEFSYSHKLELPKTEELRLHIISENELRKQMESGYYATFQTCNEDRPDEWQLSEHYVHQTEIGDCAIFWTPK